MRLLILTAFLITLALFPAQGSSLCNPPQKMHSDIIASGLVPLANMMTARGFLMTIYVGHESYLITAEDDVVACIVASGSHIYFRKGFNI